MKAVTRSAAVAALLVAILPAVPASAQKGAILGEIFDATDGKPIEKATVVVAGTKLRAVTDSLGAFRIDGVPAGEVSIRVEKSGFARITEPVLVHEGWTTGVQYELAPVAILLDALRVHVGATDAANAAIKTDEVRPTPLAGASTWDEIGSKVPGVYVMRPSGETGRGSRVIIRGPSSISLSNAPIVYMDGARVEATMQGNNKNNGYLSLDFVSPEAIDRIEVLRGPMASARYGPEARGGVILIYTKGGGH
jgi:outer membrane receptor for Fe3+-dicitrate